MGNAGCQIYDPSKTPSASSANSTGLGTKGYKGAAAISANGIVYLIDKCESAV